MIEVHAYQSCDVACRWAACDRGGRSLLHDSAVLQDEQTVGQHDGLEWIVRDDQGRSCELG